MSEQIRYPYFQLPQSKPRLLFFCIINQSDTSFSFKAPFCRKYKSFQSIPKCGTAETVPSILDVQVFG